MNRLTNLLRWGVGLGLLGGALGLGLAGLSLNGVADWDETHERHDDDHEEYRGTRTAARPSPVYIDECGSCHMAYPASLLPRRSWQAVMQGLDDHFGENAELMPGQQQQVAGYLLTNAADVAGARRGYRLLRGVGAAGTPLRITELPYFRHEHDEIPRRLVEDNAKVGSLGQCQACHGPGAERGVFDEHSVNIPGYGAWD